MQIVRWFQRNEIAEVFLPEAEKDVLPGLPWGSADELFTSAYWAAIARMDDHCVAGPHRLGNSLLEEVAACLLGGYGIPAELGLAAFASLREAGLLADRFVDEAAFHEVLSGQFSVGARNSRYRFARQKSRYLAIAVDVLRSNEPPLHSGRALRNWLLRIPGIGWKTASWIARNWLDADDVAILDVHVFRAGLLAGLFQPGDSVPRDYPALERRFIDWAIALGVRASSLDALIWREMRSSPHLVAGCLGNQIPDLTSHAFRPTTAKPAPARESP